MIDALSSTIRSLRAHALRFALTSLGIVWGAFLLTYLSSSMEGVDAHFTREMEEVGPKIVIVWPGSVPRRHTGDHDARPVELEHADVRRIESLGTVEEAAPDLQFFSQIVRTRGRTKLFNVSGVDHRSGRIRNLVAAEGRFLTPTDVAQGARVAYLGHEAARRLFGGAPPVGATVQIESLRFRVVGVNEAKGDQMIGVNGWDDSTVFVPWTTAQRWLLRDDHVAQLAFAPTTRHTSPRSIGHVREIVGLHHDFPPEVDTALHFFNVHEMLSIIDTIFLGFRIFLVGAGVVTLLVGGVGVMNIMLVIVAERTPEIGLRKAVGARSRTIFLQFLGESATVCLLSGVVGAALGVGFTQLMASLAPPDGPFGSAPLIAPFAVAVVVLALSAVGILAGVIPAWQAARIPPAEALRRA